MGKYDDCVFTIPKEFHSWYGFATPRGFFRGTTMMEKAKVYLDFTSITKELIMEYPHTHHAVDEYIVLATADFNHFFDGFDAEIDRPGLAASFAAAVSDTLVPRAIEAAVSLGYGKLSVAGGVAANSRIRADLNREAQKAGLTVYAPPLRLCGDNGAMIAAQGYYEYLAGHTATMDLNAYATMGVDRAKY